MIFINFFHKSDNIGFCCFSFDSAMLFYQKMPCRQKPKSLNRVGKRKSSRYEKIKFGTNGNR
jgi:hypothetical protein